MQPVDILANTAGVGVERRGGWAVEARGETVFLVIALNSMLMNFRLKFLRHMGMLIY